MKHYGPTAAYIEQTRSLIQQSHADLKRFRRGVESAQETIRRSTQLAEEALRKARSLKSALILK